MKNSERQEKTKYEYNHGLPSEFYSSFLNSLRIVFSLTTSDITGHHINYLQTTDQWYEIFLFTCQKFNRDKTALHYINLNIEDLDIFNRVFAKQLEDKTGIEGVPYTVEPKIKEEITQKLAEQSKENTFFYTMLINENKKYKTSLKPVHLEYNGYFTDAVFSYEDDVWYGTIKPVENPETFRDLVSFDSATLEDLEKEFHLAVEDYLEFKREIENDKNKKQGASS